MKTTLELDDDLLIEALPRLHKRGPTNPNAELHRRLAEGDVEDAVAWLDRAPRGARGRG